MWLLCKIGYYQLLDFISELKSDLDPQMLIHGRRTLEVLFSLTSHFGKNRCPNLMPRKVNTNMNLCIIITWYNNWPATLLYFVFKMINISLSFIKLLHSFSSSELILLWNLVRTALLFHPHTATSWHYSISYNVEAPFTVLLSFFASHKGHIKEFSFKTSVLLWPACCCWYLWTYDQCLWRLLKTGNIPFWVWSIHSSNL